MQTNGINSPKMSDCGSHLHNFTLLGCPGNESVSHFHRTLCFSLENASRTACLLENGKDELRKIYHILK